MILLVGRTGIVARAFQKALGQEAIHVVGSDVTNIWTKRVGIKYVDEYISKLPEKPSIIFNASGKTNPLESAETLKEINFNLPVNLLNYAYRNDIKLITLGSVMEADEETCSGNLYLQSKTMFLDYVLQKEFLLSNLFHAQLHTLYGGWMLHPHMFLGQIFNALRAKSVFIMQDGNQLREYHHVDDDIAAILSLIEMDLIGIHKISHGEILKLKSIAETIFSAFNLDSNLVNLSTSQLVNRKYLLGNSKNSKLNQINFRDSMIGIIEYINELLVAA